MTTAKTVAALATVGCLFVAAPAAGLVHYEQGRRLVQGVQLLQDAGDPSLYYYLPQFPRLATGDDGTPELLCLKYVDVDGGTSGGLLHALVEFDLPPEVVSDLQTELQKQAPGARIVGPVPLLQAVEDGEDGVGSFEVVSAILSDQAEGGFTRSLVTSGRAPLSPGSKAVVAAILDQRGATLLWDSMTGPTSDVSVAIHAYYEAAVKAYNARVVAEVSTVYEHFSRLSNVQKTYTRRQLRKIVDDLQRDGSLSVEVVDRTKSLGVSAAELEGILQIVTDKLTEVMFNHETGWAADPQREVAVEANQIQGRQKRGWFSRVFGKTKDTKYYTDDQWVLKRREDIRRNTFSINLAKDTTIKVAVDTAGNLAGLWDALGTDTRHFRIVNLDDPAFERRQVHFGVDGAYLDSFQDTVNFVTVNVRKSYEDEAQPAFTRTLTFTHDDVAQGKIVKDLSFPRLGAAGPGWTEYEYQVRWSLRDGPTLSLPPKEGEWIRGQDAAVSLVPPFTKRVVEVEADRQLFVEGGVATAVVEFATVLADQPKLRTKTTLRAGDADPVTRLAVYHDRGEPVAYRVSWYAAGGVEKGDLEVLESDYLFLVPPSAPGDDAGVK